MYSFTIWNMGKTKVNILYWLVTLWGKTAERFVRIINICMNL